MKKISKFSCWTSKPLQNQWIGGQKQPLWTSRLECREDFSQEAFLPLFFIITGIFCHSGKPWKPRRPLICFFSFDLVAILTSKLCVWVDAIMQQELVPNRVYRIKLHSGNNDLYPGIKIS